MFLFAHSLPTPITSTVCGHGQYLLIESIGYEWNEPAA